MSTSAVISLPFFPRSLVTTTFGVKDADEVEVETESVVEVVPIAEEQTEIRR